VLSERNLLFGQHEATEQSVSDAAHETCINSILPLQLFLATPITKVMHGEQRTRSWDAHFASEYAQNKYS
jgi:hypothetical protein